MNDEPPKGVINPHAKPAASEPCPRCAGKGKCGFCHNKGRVHPRHAKNFARLNHPKVKP